MITYSRMLSDAEIMDIFKAGPSKDKNMTTLQKIHLQRNPPRPMLEKIMLWLMDYVIIIGVMVFGFILGIMAN